MLAASSQGEAIQSQSPSRNKPSLPCLKTNVLKDKNHLAINNNHVSLTSLYFTRTKKELGGVPGARSQEDGGLTPLCLWSTAGPLTVSEYPLQIPTPTFYPPCIFSDPCSEVSRKPSFLSSVRRSRWLKYSGTKGPRLQLREKVQQWLVDGLSRPLPIGLNSARPKWCRVE